MKHRIFIAINLPGNVKDKIANYESYWPELPARWTKKENLHITLFFLGYIVDSKISEILKIAEETAQKHSPFNINLNLVHYGPPKRMPPRMIWVEGERSQALINLHEDFKKGLLSSSFKQVAEKEKRPLSPHITVARIREWDFRHMEPEEVPLVNESIDITFDVSSIEIMESQLKRGGPEYTILQSYKLL